MISPMDHRSLSISSSASASHHSMNDYQTCIHTPGPSHSHGPHPHGHMNSNHNNSHKTNVLWLVPQNTKPSQCLHLSLRTKGSSSSTLSSPSSSMSPSPPSSPHHHNSEGEMMEIIASEYQCLYGHRCSHLLIELYQKMNQEQQSQQTCLTLVEDDETNILQALLYIHSDSPEKILSDCSPLILGRTASYLQIHHLSQLIATEASRNLAYHLDRALEPGLLQMSVWDSIALLHLLGDQEDLLSLVQLSHWCHR
jgi:hypothetical protein